MKHTTTPVIYAAPSDRVTLSLCIGIAIICWLSVKLSSVCTTTNQVSLNYTLPQGKVFLDTPPRQATVLLDGIGWRLITNQLHFAAPSVKVDLREVANQNLDKNYFQSQISNAVKAHNPAVEIKEVKLDNINLALSEAFEKKVPVVQNCNITFREGYGKKAEPILLPDSVTVQGPKVILDGIKEWQTIPQSFANVPRNIVFVLDLAPPTSDEICINATQTQVEVPVEQLTERVFIIPITPENKSDAVKFMPDKVKVCVKVGLSHYESISEADFIVKANMPTTETARYASLTLFQKPLQVDSVQLRPSVVSVYRIKVKH
jgi:hypothetical protein